MNKKKIIIIMSIISVLILAVFLIRPLFKSDNGIGFELIEIKKGELENIVTSTGTLSALETVEVGSQVSGIVRSLNVDFNDSVKKGQVLAVLDKTLFELSVRDAEAKVSQARASLAQATAEVKRNQSLFDKGHISEMEFLILKTTAQTAEAGLQIARASLNKARTNLEYTVIRSPIDGTVIERTVDAGQTIAASFQAPKLFIIAEDLTRMQIEAQVDESDIGQIKKNQEVRFTVLAYSEKTFNGTVRQIRLQPETVQNVVNYTVIVDAPNNEGLLLPGMTATVDFVVENVSDVLLVPNKALTYTPPEKMMMEIFQKQMKKRQGQGPGSFKMSEDFARVFSLNADNELVMLVIRKGVTDGINTELKAVIRGELPEGAMVITGIEKIKKNTKKTEAKNTLLPMPGRGQRPR